MWASLTKTSNILGINLSFQAAWKYQILHDDDADFWFNQVRSILNHQWPNKMKEKVLHCGLMDESTLVILGHLPKNRSSKKRHQRRREKEGQEENEGEDNENWFTKEIKACPTTSRWKLDKKMQKVSKSKGQNCSQSPEGQARLFQTYLEKHELVLQTLNKDIQKSNQKQLADQT